MQRARAMKEEMEKIQEILDTSMQQGIQPAWIEAFREKAWKKFQSTPMPTHRDEKWRFSSIQKIKMAELGLNSRPNTECGKANSINAEQEFSKIKQYISRSAGSSVFVNQQIKYCDLEQKDCLKQGVIWTTFAKVIEKDDTAFEHILLKKYLNHKESRFSSEKFHSLNEAFPGEGLLLYIPQNVVIEAPFIICHILDHSNSFAYALPRVLIIAEEGAKVNVVDFYMSQGGAVYDGFFCGVFDIFAASGARVFRESLQNWDKSVQGFHLESVVADADSNVKSISVHLGGSYIRHESEVHVEGSRASIELCSLGITAKTQELDQRTLQIHKSPGSYSNLLYKNILSDESRAIFSGLIRVDKNASQTDAYQKNCNLLLSPMAEINTLPGLEIEANDVKCSHGATVGKLEKEDLFYMLSRGISQELAKELLVFSFFEEVIEKVENHEIKSLMKQWAQAKCQESTTS